MGDEADADWEAGMLEAGREYVENDVRDKRFAAVYREPSHHLYVTDAELIRRLGVPERPARAALRHLDKLGSGFPKKQKLWGDRRYWPAVKAWFDRDSGATLSAQRGGER